ncbi:arsenite efflux MFS transporter ArsK [Agrobacterium vitis]|uniref:arsenite efflux MFS transporter ArsK n=1 Tax=Agrobacterium vitis TaxID=373 RepID=UPI0015D99CD5|nr:arsenite efflux MFS transporter ArsK [Agrobacterium vitis]
MSLNRSSPARLFLSTDRGEIFVIIALGLTQIIGYGTLYYSFSILAPAMAADLGWSNEWIFATLSAALLAGGLVAPWVGRIIDDHGAGRVLTVGSMIAALSLAACAFAPGKITFVMALIVIEMASTLVQYTAAFAFLVQFRPQSAQRNITYLTLIAGFASTIFWPLTSALHADLSWRQVYLVYARLHLAVCLPLHRWLARRVGERHAPVVAPSATPHHIMEGGLPDRLRPIAFLLMVTGFALESFVNAALLVHMVPLLTALGLGSAAILVGTLFGSSQVLSRFTNMMFGRDLSQLTLALVSALLMPGAVAVLLLTAPSFSGALIFAVLFGLGSGLGSIVQGTLPLALFGSAGYGRRQGHVTAVRLVVSSTAPFAFAWMMENMGTDLALAINTAIGGVAVLVFLAIAHLALRQRTMPT